MEDILDVYHRPYDPLRPVVCFDELFKELRATPRGKIGLRPGAPDREDYEYQRNGTCNLFLWVEPLTGRRSVTVTERRAATDFADQVRHLVDVDYAEAQMIVLVVDNLNTHQPGSLYDRFAPDEAHRINSKIEWHYTPEHGSWLNMAEIELSVLSRQCVAGRIPDIQTVRERSSAWTDGRNNQKAAIRWQFKTEDARIKLRRLYPTSQAESCLS